MIEDMKRLCVYCGSSNKVDEKYKDASRKLGKIIAEAGLGLVYGGGGVGLMGIVSEAVMQHGGEVVGIIPSHIADKELANDDLTELHVVETMHERKQMMVDRSDAFIIMPGGLGTMDEFFEIFTWWQLELHDKPIVIVNIDGYWSPLIALIDNIIKEGFAREADKKHISIIDTPEELIEALKKAPRETISADTKWI